MTLSAVSWPAWAMGTRMESAIGVRATEDAGIAAARLAGRRFDQAPVTDERGRPLGWVRTDVLRAFESVGEAMTPLELCTIQSRDTDLSTTVPAVASSGFVFLAGDAGLTHFVVPSDLDRHAVRGYFFDILSQVEMHLAHAVRQRVEEPRIREVLTRRQLQDFRAARKVGLEAHAVEYLYLRNYIDLLRGSQSLRAHLGLQESHLTALGQLSDLRNAVAHSSSSLLARREPTEVADLASKGQDLLSVLRRSEPLLP